MLAHGGWLLVDPRPTARAHPDTFELPVPDELAALQPGSYVRAMFACATIADETTTGLAPYDAQGRPRLTTLVERMWAIVLEVDGTSVRCGLDNQPFSTHCRLFPGAVVHIPLSHLIATGRPTDDLDGFRRWIAEQSATPAAAALTHPQDPLALPRVHPAQQAVCAEAGVPPHPPSPFGQLLVARDVTPDSSPLYGGRFPPDSERRDAGWMIWATHGDLETAQREAGFAVVTMQQAYEQCPAARPYVALPPGWGFTADRRGGGRAYPIEIEG